MKSTKNLKAVTNYRELFDENYCSREEQQAGLKKMQELSDSLKGAEPTAISKIEVYKECHRLVDDLYRLTGSKRLFAHVLKIGNLLLSRLFNDTEKTAQVYQ